MKFSFASFSRMKEAWEYRSEPENARVLGEYLWRTLLGIAFVALLCAAWLGYQELGVVTQAESAVTAPASAPSAPLDPDALQAQLNSFSATEQEYQTLSLSPLPQIPDPSQ